MKIQILTIFPDVCRCVFSESILKRAQEKKLATLEAVDLRKWTSDRHRTVDDAPYGGGPGMVMKIEPIDLALSELRSPDSKVILLSPKGANFQTPSPAILPRKQISFFSAVTTKASTSASPTTSSMMKFPSGIMS